MSQLTEFMREKWTFWMSVCDFSKEGMMSPADWTKGAEKLIQDYNLTGKKADEVKESFAHLGAIMIGDNNMRQDTPVPTSKVVTNLMGFLLTQRAEALEYFDSVIRHMFSAVDTDGDDFVNEDEFRSVCKSLLIKEKYWPALCERVRNRETGRINITTAVVWFVDFLMGVDRFNWEEQQALFAI